MAERSFACLHTIFLSRRAWGYAGFFWLLGVRFRFLGRTQLCGLSALSFPFGVGCATDTIRSFGGRTKWKRQISVHYVLA